MNKIYLSDSSSLADPTLFKKAYALLSPTRKEKADRYQNECSKRNGVLAYLLLRHALKEEGILLSSEKIEYGKYGKPYLSSKRCFFNLSHCGSGKIAVIVSDQEVGIDVEDVSSAKLDIAKRYFTEKENEVLAKSAHPDAAFIRLWTLKEALLKKKGTGLSESLSAYDFSSSVYQDAFDAYDAHFEALDLGDCLVSAAMVGPLEAISSVDAESLAYEE